MPIMFGDQTAELLLHRAQTSFQIASENYEFATNQARLKFEESGNFKDALAVRIVEESGSGRVRITDPTVAGMGASAK